MDHGWESTQNRGHVCAVERGRETVPFQGGSSPALASPWPSGVLPRRRPQWKMTEERLGWWETRGGEDRGEGDEEAGRLVVCFIEALAR